MKFLSQGDNMSHSRANAGSLTHQARPGLRPSPPQRQCWICPTAGTPVCILKNQDKIEVPIVTQQLTNLNHILEDSGSNPGLASGLRIQCWCELWQRLQMWFGSGWLWLWLAAIARIWPLAWELPYASGVALKTKKKNLTKEVSP